MEAAELDLGSVFVEVLIFSERNPSINCSACVVLSEELEVSENVECGAFEDPSVQRYELSGVILKCTNDLALIRHFQRVH